jgi:hypothetical protein
MHFHSKSTKFFCLLILGYSRVDMHGVAYEAVFIYCKHPATKQIGLPEGENTTT